MEDYKVEWNEPLCGHYRDHKLWTIPAPASGAIWLNTMGILSQFDTEGSGTVTDLHRLTEALRVSRTGDTMSIIAH
jgi:gamma-glutamyltranspeptidase/glutathione hydrolase